MCPTVGIVCVPNCWDSVCAQEAVPPTRNKNRLLVETVPPLIRSSRRRNRVRKVRKKGVESEGTNGQIWRASHAMRDWLLVGTVKTDNRNLEGRKLLSKPKEMFKIEGKNQEGSSTLTNLSRKMSSPRIFQQFLNFGNNVADQIWIKCWGVRKSAHSHSD